MLNTLGHIERWRLLGQAGFILRASFGRPSGVLRPCLLTPLTSSRSENLPVAAISHRSSTTKPPPYFQARRDRRHSQPQNRFVLSGVLPQLVDPSQGSVIAQLLELGCLFVLMAVIIDSCYALLADTAGQ